MKVHALQTGTVAIKERQRRGVGHGPRRRINTLLDQVWTEPLPIYAWAIEHPEGLIVVDTGETARALEPGYFTRWNPYFRLGVREWVRPEKEEVQRKSRSGIMFPLRVAAHYPARQPVPYGRMGLVDEDGRSR